MAVGELRAVPNILKASGVVVLVGAIAEGLLFLGVFDRLPESVLDAAGLLFGVIGLVVLVGLPIVMYRRYRLVSPLVLLVVLVSFSVVTTLLSLELPGWILVIGLWPVAGVCYFGAGGVEYLVRRTSPS